MTDAERDEMLTTMAAQVAELHALYVALKPLIEMGMAGGVPAIPSVRPW